MYSNKRIAMYYLRTTFFIDLISIFPTFMYFSIVNDHYVHLYYLKVLRLIFSRTITSTVDLVFEQVTNSTLTSIKVKKVLQVISLYLKFVL